MRNCPKRKLRKPKENGRYQFVDMLVMHTFFETVVSISMAETEKRPVSNRDRII